MELKSLILIFISYGALCILLGYTLCSYIIKPFDTFNYTVRICYGKTVENISNCFDIKTQFNRIECRNICFPSSDCYYICTPVQLTKPVLFIETENITYLKDEKIEYVVKK